MKQAFIILSLSSAFTLQAADPVCHKCEVIREQNARRTDYYKYYDDYAKDHPEAERPQKIPQNDDNGDEVHALDDKRK